MKTEREAPAFPGWQKRIFAVCWLTYTIAYTGRYNLTVALHTIQTRFGIDYSKAAMLATVFLWVYACGQLVNGFVGDRVNSRYYVFCGMAVSAAVNLSLGFVRSFPLFLLLWGLNGFVQSMLWGPIMRVLGQWFSGTQRDNVAFAMCTSMVAGTLIAWGLLGALLSRFGELPVFLLPGIAILLSAVMWLIFVRQSPKDAGFEFPVHKPEREALPVHPSEGFVKIAVATGLPVMVFCCVALGALKEGVNQLGPTLVLETSRVSLKELPLYIAFIPVMNFFGVLLARLLFRVTKGDGGRSSALMFAAAAVAASVLIVGSGNVLVSALCMGVCSMMMNGINSILLGIVPVRYTEYGKVSAVAGLLDFSSYFAAGIFVAVGGFLRDLTGNWATLFLFWTVLAAVGICLSVLSKKYFAKTDRVTSAG